MTEQPPENANEGCVGPQSSQAGKAAACEGCPNQSACSSGLAQQKDPTIRQVADNLKDIKHKILILSGKGGVGKSTVCSHLAWYLSGCQGKQVGVLDVDICGPSIPRMFHVEERDVHRSNYGWTPVYVNDNLSVMSIGFMLGSRNDAVVWRGPRKNGLIRQFLVDVEWSSLDFLLIDTPPGTSDEHISVVKYLEDSNVDGAIIVTTPQEMSLLDVRKEINFCRKIGLPVIGVIENMSCFKCPSCNANSDIFSPNTGGAEKLCSEFGVPFLGKLPIEKTIGENSEKGTSPFGSNASSNSAKETYSRVFKLLSSTKNKNKEL